MRTDTAQQVVDILRGWGLSAHLARVSPYRHGVRIVLNRDTEAVWDTDGATGLEAQILGNGKLVGLVPKVPGTDESLPAQRIAEIIAHADYKLPGT